MHQERYLTILSNRKKIVLSVGSILYVLMQDKTARIHVSGGRVYETRMRLGELEEALGESFLKLHRGCLVSVRAVHDVTDTVNLSNGESLEYAQRKRSGIIEELHARQRSLIGGFSGDGTPRTPEEYRAYYAGAHGLPFAFTDIEMVFNEERRAVDWIFRYGNPALAKLEKLPLERLVGSSFGSLFANMDSKWLRCYERAVLYGEILEIVDYSPEIDTWLKVTCFPTFPGHCGCILFDLTRIRYIHGGADAAKALTLYLGRAECLTPPTPPDKGSGV